MNSATSSATHSSECQANHPTDFSFTASAAAKVHELIVDHPTPLMLQIYITGGGCHGFGITKLADGHKQDDIIISRHWPMTNTRFSVLIDRISHNIDRF